MIGELTLEEKLAVIESALKELHLQIFRMELQGVANVELLAKNPEVAKQHDEQLAALNRAVARLEYRHMKLAHPNVVLSDPSSQTCQPVVPEQN